MSYARITDECDVYAWVGTEFNIFVANDAEYHAGETYSYDNIRDFYTKLCILRQCKVKIPDEILDEVQRDMKG